MDLQSPSVEHILLEKVLTEDRISWLNNSSQDWHRIHSAVELLADWKRITGGRRPVALIYRREARWFWNRYSCIVRNLRARCWHRNGVLDVERREGALSFGEAFTPLSQLPASGLFGAGRRSPFQAHPVV